MSAAPNNITYQRLHEFRQRRRTLDMSQGMAIAITCIVLAMLAAVLVDFTADAIWVRWLSAGLVYGVALLAAYWCCWRPWRSRESWQSEAQRFEDAEPRLREKLLPAVELPTEDQATLHDSIAFRQKLHEQVADSVRDIKVAELLPWKRVRRWLLTGLGTLLAIGLLAMIPQLHLPQRLARVLFPAANLDRVALVAIEIEAPTPNSKVIASGDILEVVAKVDGLLKGSVTLESRTPDGQVQTAVMRPNSSSTAKQVSEPVANTQYEGESEHSNRFQSTLSVVGQEDESAESWIEYRVSADGARTAWHRLTARPRPNVESFAKQVTPPEYAQLPPQVTTEEHGDVTALVGSKVKLSIVVNQPVKVAELRWLTPDQAGVSQTQSTNLTLNADSPSGSYSTEFVVEKDAEYRIHLESTETGFANEFGASYRVRAIEDGAPLVRWTKPAGAIAQTVSRDQIISLSVSVADEMPVAKQTQLVRVNERGEWIEMAVETAQTDNVLRLTRDPSETTWKSDLLKYSLKTGDVVETKLQAVDRKGQMGESEIVKLFVASSSISVAATASDEARQSVAKKVDEFAKQIADQQNQLREMIDPKKDNKQPDQVPKPATSEEIVEAAKALAKSFEDQVPQLLDEIEKAQADVTESANAMELEKTGVALSSLQSRVAPQLELMAERLQSSAQDPNDEKQVQKEKQLRKEIQQRAEQLSNSTNQVSQAMHSLVSHDTLRRMGEEISRLSEQFENYIEDKSSDDQQKQREIRVLARQLQELQSSMMNVPPEARQETKDRMRQNADAIGSQLAQLQNAAKEFVKPNAEQAAQQVANNLKSLKLPTRLDGNLHDEINRAHRVLSDMGGQASDVLREAVNELNAPAKEDEREAQQRKAAEAQAAALMNLADRRSQLKARHDADRQFASDLGNAERATREVVENSSLSNSDKQRELNEVVKSVDVLQSAHAVEEASQLLEDVLRAERWGLKKPDALIEHPRVWEAFAERVEKAAHLMRQAQLPQELSSQVDQMRWNEAAQRVGQKINSRRWEEQSPVSAAAELAQLSEEMSQVQAKLSELTKKARADLAEQAPSLEQLAQQAAEETRDLQKETETLAKSIERKEVPNEGSRLEQLKQQQAELNQPLTDLREALADQADAQNLLDRQQLQKARNADMALGVVDQVQQNLEQSLPDNPAGQLPQALNEAAGKQDQAASALEQLAEQLARAANGEDNVEGLRELAGQLGEPQEMADRYRDAEQLAKLAQAQPAEVMRQLEKRLQQSEPMQQELSQITREAAEQALNRLDRAANQQQQLQPELEASDPVTNANKRMMIQDIQASRDNANQMLGLMVSEAKWTAGAAKQEPLQKEMNAVEESLRKAMEESAQANMQKSLGELQQTAKELSESLQNAQNSLKQAAEQLQKAGEEQVHQNPADLANRRREMQDRQRRVQQQDVRNLQQAERTQLQQVSQADREINQAQSRERSLNQHLENAKKQLDKKPDDQYLREQAEQAARNLALSQSQKAAAEQFKQQMQDRLQQATKDREEANQQFQGELEKANPSAQLSSKLAEAAANRSAQLAQRLQEWAQKQPPASQATSEQLAATQHGEQSIQNAVEDSSEDLARASRHEARLNNRQASLQLAQHADNTKAVEQQQVQAAEDSLDQAKQNAQQSQSATGQTSAEATSQALEKMSAAEDAIRKEADALREMVNSSNQPPSQSSPSRNEAQANGQSDNQPLLDPQQMAQLLDELDQRMSAQPQSTPGQQEANTPSQSQASQQPGQQTPSTLQAAADKLSSQLSRNRQPKPSNSDQGMATESSMANVDPQGPSAVKIVEVLRVDDDWGNLREQKSQEMLESRRESIAPEYRRQIDAYFRILAERSQNPQK